MTTETLQAQAQQAADFWKKLMDDQLALFDHATKLVKDNLAYSAELGAEYRRLGLEATRKVTQFVAGKA